MDITSPTVDRSLSRRGTAAANVLLEGEELGDVFQHSRMSALGTNAKRRHVRYTAALGAEADIQAALGVRVDAPPSLDGGAAPALVGKLSGLVAAALPARDRAAVVPFNRGCLHAAALSWADGHTTGAEANCCVGATVPIVAVVAVPPDLNIDALGLGRSDERGSRQHRCGCRYGKSDLHHVESSLGLI
jgi:hypothetical protein